MIRALFQRVKRFVQCHSGVTALAEAQAATRASLAALAETQAATQGVLARLASALDEVRPSLWEHSLLLRRLVAAPAELGLDRWKVQEYEGLLRYLRKSLYETALASGRLEIPVVEAERHVAADTDDTRFPWGARNDNSICLKFNTRLYQLFPGKPRLAVLDLGCAGGGFVRSLLDDGHLAVGLDGCDLPRRDRLGEWGTIPHHLHTCDITRPFEVKDRATGRRLGFDAITAWEVMEHIRDADLDGLFANVTRHLAEGGLFLCSISTVEDGNPEVGAVYHQTVRPRPWWEARFRSLGFEVHEQNVIGKDDWLRGSGNCRLDRRAEDEGIGFHLVLRRAPASARKAA